MEIKTNIQKNLTMIYILLIVVFVLGPLLTFLHELGHAAIPLINGANVKIVMGIDSFNVFSIIIGSLEVVWNNTFLPWTGYTRFDDNSIFSYILGPLVSLSMFLFFKYFLASRVKSDFLQRLINSVAYWCFFQGLFTLVPFKYPLWLKGYENFSSDGLKFINLILF